MKVFIAIKFDRREVGTCIDLTESIASVLIARGLVSETEPIAEVETIKETKVEVIEGTEPIAEVETKKRKRSIKN